MCSPKLNTPDKNYQLKICQIHRSKRQNVGTELLFNKQHLSGMSTLSTNFVAVALSSAFKVHGHAMHG